METVFDVIQSLELNFVQMIVVGLLVFLVGYIAGTIRVRRLVRENNALEKAVMALNEELLYNGFASDDTSKSITPVIGLKNKSFKSPQVAK